VSGFVVDQRVARVEELFPGFYCRWSLAAQLPNPHTSFVDGFLFAMRCFLNLWEEMTDGRTDGRGLMLIYVLICQNTGSQCIQWFL
jgi:hypothetical protein